MNFENFAAGADRNPSNDAATVPPSTPNPIAKQPMRTRRIFRTTWQITCVLALGLAGCADDMAGPKGPAVYAEPFSDGNTFACATCHALVEPSADGLTRPGHPIGDAAARPNFKNGQVSDLLSAVNTCRSEWMAAPAFANDDPRWIELRSFLESEAPATAPALSFALAPVPSDPTGGDATRGRDAFNRTCVVCHGTDAAGTERAPRISGYDLAHDYIALRVRTSGDEDSPTYDGLTGGRMPFWAADRLSDTDLIDIAAFIHESPAPGEPDAGVPPSDAGGSDAGDCSSTHSRVGQVAELTTRFHGVSGTATIIDDCTISITMFNFDGQGINVQAYGALGGAYSTGFSMSDDLRRATAYQNETLTITLPSNRTLDDLDGISIWCVPAGASFGDGVFGPP